MAAFFRDTDLSDGIGFRYGQYADVNAAVDDFMRTVEGRFLDRLTGDDDRVLTIVLDGENAWGGYPEDGRPFLNALYCRLAADRRLKTVTFSEYLRGNPERGIEPHPIQQLARVYDLATRVWTRMLKTDSLECRNCHVRDAMDTEVQSEKAKSRHAKAKEEGQTCIEWPVTRST